MYEQGAINGGVTLWANTIAHFWQHFGMIKGRKKQMAWWVAWVTVIWSIWKLKNDIFSNSSCDLEELLEAIKFRSWSWSRSFVEGLDIEECLRHLA